MQRSRKIIGFTLIELLAVILILGVIALIAIPTVSNIISQSRKGALRTTIQNVVRAIENQCELEKVKGLTHTSLYNFSSSGVSPSIDVKGNLPTEGVMTVDNDCNVTINVSTDKYTATKQSNSDTIVISDRTSTSSYTLGYYVDYLLSESGIYTYMDGTYLKGLQERNYLWYSGNLYRIMGKDKNGNIKLISEENISATVYDSIDSTKSDFSNSYMKEYLNDYFYNRFGNPHILQTTPYCIDSASDATSARTTCTSMFEDSKVVLISLDEYQLSRDLVSASCSEAGLIAYQATIDNDATNSDLEAYLSNNNTTCMDFVKDVITDNVSYLSPRITYDDENEIITIALSYLDGTYTQNFETLTHQAYSGFHWYVSLDGNLKYSAIDRPAGGGIRPIITVPANIPITGGDGLRTTPIMLESIQETTGNLIDNATSGEYVIIEGKRYRVVENISKVGTKIVLDGYLPSLEPYTRMITKMSNNTYLSDLGLSEGDERLVNYAWTTGNIYAYGDKYTNALEEVGNTFTSYVGGIKLGEMYSAQSSLNPSSTYYFTLTPSSSSYSWGFNSVGNATFIYATYGYSIRPALVISPSTKITSGNGTLANPYII